MRPAKQRFEKMIKKSSSVLTEGGIVERINRHTAVTLDPNVAHAGLIYDKIPRQILTDIYREYLDIGQEYNLPMMTMAPTWRANPQRVARSVFSKKTQLNRDCVEFLKEILNEYGNYRDSIYLGGLMSCANDAYDPSVALSSSEAARFHRNQAEALAQSGVEFIKVATLPAFSEALGMAQSLSTFDIPYILSFVITKDGDLLDGTSLAYAIGTIDTKVNPSPIFYMINCVHPSIYSSAMTRQRQMTSAICERVLGIQANTSAKSPAELDDSPQLLHSSDPMTYADQVVALQEQFGVKIFGGCCGSNGQHIREIAKRLVVPN